MVQMYLAKEKTHFCSYYFMVMCRVCDRHDDSETDPAV